MARGPSPAGSAPHVTTGSAPRDSQASIDATNRAKPTLDGSNTAKPAPHRWFGPEWQAEEKAETEHLKRVTNICRC